jgi:hypothetical protein
MVPFVGPDPELSDLETMPVLLCMQPIGQEAEADDGIPFPVPLKNIAKVDAVEEVTTESLFQPYLIPLHPCGSADTVPLRSGIPLGSISLAWDEKEDPRTSISEKVVIEIACCWSVRVTNAIDRSTSGLLAIPVPAKNERSGYLFSSDSNMDLSGSNPTESLPLKLCRRAR